MDVGLVLCEEGGGEAKNGPRTHYEGCVRCRGRVDEKIQTRSSRRMRKSVRKTCAQQDQQADRHSNLTDGNIRIALGVSRPPGVRIPPSPPYFIFTSF